LAWAAAKPCSAAGPCPALGALIANAWIFHVLVTLVPASYALARPLGSLVVYLGFSYPLWTRVFSRAHPFPTEEPGT